MIKSKRKAGIRNLFTTFILIAAASGVASYLPLYISVWSQNLSLVLGVFLCIVFLSPIGKERVGDASAQLPLMTSLHKIFCSYLIITLFIFSFFILMMTAILEADTQQIMGVLQQNFAVVNYPALSYPWIIYIFGVVIISAIGYKVAKPKISGTLAALLPLRYLGGFFGAVLDFIGIMGFYVGILCLIGTAAMALAKLLALTFGDTLSYKLNIALMGVVFALIYLPFSPLWQMLYEKLKRRNFGLGLTLLLFIVGFASFLLAMYTGIDLFLLNFARLFVSIEQTLPQIMLTQQLADVHFGELLWGIGMITCAVVSGWWLQYVQGYELRSVILILLAPLLVVVGIVELLYYALSPEVLAIISDWGSRGIAWCCSAPQAYLIGLVASAILIISMRQENNFIVGLFLIMPNLAGRKLSRWRILIMRNSGFIGISIVFSIFFGFYFAQMVIFIFATLFSFVLTLMLLSLAKYLLIRKLS